MEQVTLAFGALRFTPVILVLDLILFLHFILRWRQAWKRTGWSISFWDLNLLYAYIFPVLLEYPFAAAPFQVLSVGDAVDSMAAQVDRAYGLTILGFLSAFAGRILYDRPLRASPLGIPKAVMFPWMQIVSFNLGSRYVVAALVLMSAPFLPFLFSALGSLDNPFELRNSFLANQEERPIFNAALSVFPLIPLYSMLMFSDRRKSVYLIVFVLSSLVLGLFGARSTLLLTFLNNVMFFVFSRGSRVSIFKLVLLGSLLLIAGIALGAVRSGESPLLALVGIGSALVYGNTFSDLRDFSWVLSSFDGRFLFGRTELAGLMSFVPSSMSDFRQTWNSGVYTAKLLGFSPSEHAGVRVGLFGESYLNFGIIGIVVAGLLWGYSLRYADRSIRDAVESGRGIRAGFVATLPFALVSSLLWTAGFWTLYVFLLVNALLFLLLSTLRINASTNLTQRYA